MDMGPWLGTDVTMTYRLEMDLGVLRVPRNPVVDECLGGYWVQAVFGL